jgi:hypothetical protein
MILNCWSTHAAISLNNNNNKTTRAAIQAQIHEPGNITMNFQWQTLTNSTLLFIYPSINSMQV